jgi:hypothetical protein
MRESFHNTQTGKIAFSGSAMTAEYSYFRAEDGGKSAAAIQAVQTSKRAMRDLKRNLCDIYNANEIWGRVSEPGEKIPGNDQGHYYIENLSFDSDDNVPEGWVISQHAEPGRPGSIAAAMPAPGSEDDFHLRQARVLLDDYMRTTSLEDVFGCGQMPMRVLPPGEYNGSFVMHSRLRRPHAGETFRKGMLSDNATFLFGSNGPCKIADPLDYKFLDGKWYIRVPNDEQGRPRITPPDSEPVGYSRMQELDQREFYRPTYKGVYIR